MLAKHTLLGLAAVCLALTACDPNLGGWPQPEPGEEPAEPAEPDEEPADPDEEPADPDEEPADPDEEPADPDEEPADPDEEPADVCGPFDPPAIDQDAVPVMRPLVAGLDCEALTGPVRPTRLGPHPESLPLPAACGDRASNYTVEGAADDSPYEVHVVSVYEGGIDIPEAVGIGAVEVVIERTARPVVLVLTGYDEVRWRLLPTPDARIAGVIAVGYDAPRVAGSPVPVQILDHREICDLGYGWEARHNTGGGDQRAMMAGIRAALGQTESSFQGCYGGRRFTVPYAECPETVAPVPDALDEQSPPGSIDAGACADVTAESLFCATNTQGGLSLVGLDSGDHCRVGPAHGMIDSLTWLGPTLYACGDRGLSRFRFDTGEWETLEATCSSVATDGGDLLVGMGGERPDRALMQLGAVFRFAGVVGLLNGDVLDQFAPEAHARRIAVDRGILYSAWHSTDRIERFDMAQGVALEPVMLEDFDEWVHGFDVIGGRIVIQSPEGIFVFNADTGERLFGFPVDRRVFHTGMACAAGGRTQ